MTASPFIPGTKIQFAWDSTSLGWLKECPRKYQYAMIEQWRSKSDHPHLVFGIHYHTALERYYKLRQEGVAHLAAMCKVVHETLINTWSEGAPWSSDHPKKNRETLIRTIVWYLDLFEEDPATTVVLEDGRPAVELSFQFGLDYGPLVPEAQIDGPDNSFTNINYVLCGHIDRLVTFAGDTYVMDHKTTGQSIGQFYFAQFKPDNQMSLYTLASQVVFHAPVKAVMIDAAEVAVGFTRYGRGFTYRTNDELEEFLKETKVWLRLSEEFAIANYWPRNDKSCFGCQFRETCSQDPVHRRRWLETGFEKREWNPLIAR